MDIQKEIIKVIETERDVITVLARNIGREYKKAVEMIYKCKGKVIVTGVGKSGMVAQKIAATMVSTGTMAIFLHPSDGMHGDLGLVTNKDVVIAIGKSGESDELLTILPVIKKIGAKIISITANRNSSLSNFSDVVLFTKVEREACPLGLAPTCSTTAALVAGDALAVTLMKIRNFKKKDFALYHPGGKLGKRLLLTVGEIMRKGESNPVVKINDTVKNMLFIITEKMTGAASVAGKNGTLAGLVTDYDVRKVIEKGGNIFRMRISQIMNPDPQYIYPNVKAAKALEIMENRDKPISLLPVVDKNKKPVGMIHIHDILSRGLK